MSVVILEHWCNELHDWMQLKVSGDVSDAQRPFGSARLASGSTLRCVRASIHSPKRRLGEHIRIHVVEQIQCKQNERPRMPFVGIQLDRLLPRAMASLGRGPAPSTPG